ncbi:putative toxin-antitoxin system toxin component, PIN family [Aquabacterium sp. A7-Y]|uniref:putative toxin-antitoxin system toxin component, PIN family n=1 Tax=Aquabacterium sp. A7-Y TaxID=1349605 RepID=UPI00223DA67D|nr:putative toxin-antitoxin system toxin component, PIN family [Aquabacterium sp. A7-Y]MCW7541956.1 putative toxin-antitoxin system toxin component, PIN family [Aquabacterium sp. A7-Y]
MTPAPLPAVVLDTNVLLDWLVFRDPEVLHIADAVTSGRLCWIATHSMRDELERVLTYEWIAARQPDSLHIAAIWERYAHTQEPPAPRAPMRCGDPDDQKFIDLAVARGAQWLLTKDRELLKLAKRARLRGVAVLRPADWQDSAADPRSGSQGAEQ